MERSKEGRERGRAGGQKREKKRERSEGVPGSILNVPVESSSREARGQHPCWEE